MLEHEVHIRARLEGIPGCLGVHGMADFENSIAAGRQLPAIFVGVDGYSVSGHAGQKQGVQVAVRWLVVVAGRNVSAIRDGIQARETVSTVARLACARLIGWRPPGGQSFELIDGFRPVYEAGLLLFPLRFRGSTFIEPEDA